MRLRLLRCLLVRRRHVSLQLGLLALSVEFSLLVLSLRVVTRLVIRLFGALAVVGLRFLTRGHFRSLVRLRLVARRSGSNRRSPNGCSACHHSSGIFARFFSFRLRLVAHDRRLRGFLIGRRLRSLCRSFDDLRCLARLKREPRAAVSSGCLQSGIRQDKLSPAQSPAAGLNRAVHTNRKICTHKGVPLRVRVLKQHEFRSPAKPTREDGIEHVFEPVTRRILDSFQLACVRILIDEELKLPPLDIEPRSTAELEG